MKCPYCDVEMIQGYLNCGQAIWSERKHKVSILPNRRERYALYLGSLNWVSPNHVPSDCCPKCKRIIIDAGQYETNIGK